MLVCLKDVHPVSLDLVPEELIAVLKEKYAENIQQLVSLATERDLGIDEEEIMRLFFVLQMSAFGR